MEIKPVRLKEHTELEVWKEVRVLVNLTYSFTKDFPANESFGLTNQMRRAAVSVLSNISEGCGRQHPKDSIRFLYNSKGSLYELESQLYVALDQGYLTSEDFTVSMDKLVMGKKLLNGFIRYYDTLQTH